MSRAQKTTARTAGAMLPHAARRLSAALVVVLAVTSASIATAGEAPVKLRRFAFVVGANDGGTDRVRLQYAVTDAHAFSDVLEEYGGLAPDDKLVLADPDPEQLRAGFARVASQMAAARGRGARVEFVFYYSGHSDERGLLLGGTRVTYPTLRETFAGLPADVRIAVLDSCASGALTRGKGGVRRAPFQVDQAHQVTGYAFLTSASAHEPAQESDRLGGSFFTHHLVTGLRGAADSSRDGRVTLDEAYHYAFHGTLQQTESTQAGPQHPNYAMQLSGAGDLVLTDLRGSSAKLVLHGDVAGHVFIRDADGRLAAELRKVPGTPMSLGLAPGTYQVTVESDRDLRRGVVMLTEAGPTVLEQAEMGIVVAEVTVARGGVHHDQYVIEEDGLREYRYIPVNFSFVPGLSFGGADSTDLVHGVHFAVLGGYAAGVTSAGLAAGFNIELDFVRGAQLAGGFNYTGGSVMGAQLAGGFDFAGGAVEGVQMAGGFGFAGGPVRGFQGAGGFTYSGSFYGGQAAGGFTFAAGSGRGFQGAGGFAMSTGFFHGFQGAGGFTYASGVEGAQMAGGLNISGGDVLGAQLAAVNIATGQVHGVQVGVVNYAEEADVTVGILSFTANGPYHGEVWSTDVMPIGGTLRLGGRYVHSLLSIGASPNSDDDDGDTRWGVGVGLGSYIPLMGDRLFMNIDLLAFKLFEGDRTHDIYQLGQARIRLGYRFASHFAVFAGITANALVARKDVGADWAAWKPHVERFDDPDIYVATWPGFVLGLQI